MKLTRIVAGLLATVTALTIGGAPVRARSTNGSFSDHVDLWNAVQEVGVTTFLNDRFCVGKEFSGVYSSVHSALLVCQDNRSDEELEKEVVWTPNDLDTLRHEAHHLVQDCIDGKRADGRLRNIFDTPEELVEFVKNSGMSMDKVGRIIATYQERGADDDTVLLEIEAFAVAHSVNASTIAEAVRTHCSVATVY